MFENESSLRSEEVALAAEGKQEALSSAMTEITNLKEQIFAKSWVISNYFCVEFTFVGMSLRLSFACSSQISAMEVQISCLKEDLDKRHKRWHATQSNYEW